jgi:hypothetical protein
MGGKILEGERKGKRGVVPSQHGIKSGAAMRVNVLYCLLLGVRSFVSSARRARQEMVEELSKIQKPSRRDAIQTLGVNKPSGVEAVVVVRK